MDGKVCCFTGHRNLCDINSVAERVRYVTDRLIAAGVDTFICGGARGFDLLCAQIIAEKKAGGEAVRLIHAIPCPNQSSGYSYEEKKQYEQLLAVSDEVVLVSDFYFTGCMHKRNRYMVDNSDYVVSLCTRTSGGSYYTKQYAVKKGKRVFEVGIQMR